MAEQTGTGTASGLPGLMRRPMALAVIALLIAGIGGLGWQFAKRTPAAPGTTEVAQSSQPASASPADAERKPAAAGAGDAQADAKPAETAVTPTAETRTSEPTASPATPAAAGTGADDAAPLTARQRAALAQRSPGGTPPPAQTPVATAQPQSTLTETERAALSSGQDGGAKRPIGEPMTTTATKPLSDLERQALGIPAMAAGDAKPAAPPAAAGAAVTVAADNPNRPMTDLERQALGIPAMAAGDAKPAAPATVAAENPNRPMTDLERQALGIPTMSRVEPAPPPAPAGEPKAAGQRFVDDRALGSGPAAPATGPRFADGRDLTAGSRLPTQGGPTATAPSLPAGANFNDPRQIGAQAQPAFRDDRQLAQAARAPQAGLFKDERDVGTGRLPDTAPRLPASAVPTAPRLPGGQTFADARPLVAPGSAAPSFRDERELGAQPAFRDDRAIKGLTFQDDRPVGPSAFRDDRALSAQPGALAPSGAPIPSATGVLPPGVTPAAPAADSSGRQRTTTLVAIAPQPGASALGNCEPEIATEALEAGRMAIRIRAACNRSEPVQLRYAGVEIVRQLDGWGSLDHTLDAFAGRGSPVDIRFANGTRRQVPVTARDLDRISKIAVVWRAPVNLDLHVFEYGARLGDAGHVWVRNAVSAAGARARLDSERRGHGYLSAADSDASLGDKVEVYTFFHNDQQSTGTIGLALDYETRGEVPAGETCGNGALAEVEFQLTILPRGGEPTRQSGVLTRVDCGARLAAEARFSQSALPSLRIRN